MRIERSFRLGAHTVRLETGGLARQASGAVRLDMDGTTVLATVVAARQAQSGHAFLPLTVDYQEKSHAGVHIPRGALRREGLPSEREILAARLIDRALRPLFPEGFHHEVQVILQVMSLNPDIEPDIPALLAAAAATRLAGLPLRGPLAAVRMGFDGRRLLVNPTRRRMRDSQLDLVVAATPGALVMVEAEAQELPETVILVALDLAQQQMQEAFSARDELAREAGTAAWGGPQPGESPEVRERVDEMARKAVENACRFSSGAARRIALDALAERLEAVLGDEGMAPGAVAQALRDLERDVRREQALVGELAMSSTVEEGRPVILTNIHGDEDHPGGMAFKVSGTEQGITALQMGVKGPVITLAILEQALVRARDARCRLLHAMREAQGEATREPPSHAPGASTPTTELEVGRVFDAVVVEQLDFFGVIVRIEPGYEGLLHSSAMSPAYAESWTRDLVECQVVPVRVVGRDGNGKLLLSMLAPDPVLDQQAA